jgi:hypothetical protein
VYLYISTSPSLSVSLSLPSPITSIYMHMKTTGISVERALLRRVGPENRPCHHTSRKNFGGPRNRVPQGECADLNVRMHENHGDQAGPLLGALVLGPVFCGAAHVGLGPWTLHSSDLENVIRMRFSSYCCLSQRRKRELKRGNEMVSVL